MIDHDSVVRGPDLLRRLVHPVVAHRDRRLEFLGEDRDAEFLVQPAELDEVGVDDALAVVLGGALGEQALPLVDVRHRAEVAIDAAPGRDRDSRRINGPHASASVRPHG